MRNFTKLRQTVMCALRLLPSLPPGVRVNKFRGGGGNADSWAPACRFCFLRSVVSEFLTIPFSDKLRFPFWAGTGKALENLRFSVVPHLFLKVIPGVQTFWVPRAP